MRELKINKGIELMLRGAAKKEEKEKPQTRGFTFTRFFTLLKRRVYFNLELWWEKQTD
tara:strand:+ start:474 stop:647 length:174 start_codon:yes stop_codon:yes gene_type:complete